MEKHYTGRNVDLSLLSQWIERFFKRKGFITSQETEVKRYKTIARPTHVHEIIDNIAVYVSGEPDDFGLKLVTGARSEALMKIGSLSQWLGGGVLFLRGVKSQEVEDRLEEKFWTYIEEKIDFLTNSARKLKARDIAYY